MSWAVVNIRHQMFVWACWSRDASLSVFSRFTLVPSVQRNKGMPKTQDSDLYDGKITSSLYFSTLNFCNCKICTARTTMNSPSLFKTPAMRQQNSHTKDLRRPAQLINRNPNPHNGRHPPPERTRMHCQLNQHLTPLLLSRCLTPPKLLVNSQRITRLQARSASNALKYHFLPIPLDTLQYTLGHLL